VHTCRTRHLYLYLYRLAKLEFICPLCIASDTEQFGNYQGIVLLTLSVSEQLHVIHGPVSCVSLQVSFEVSLAHLSIPK